MNRPLTYLATPYSSSLPAIVQFRVEMTQRAVVHLFKMAQHDLMKNQAVISPIVAFHPIVEVANISGDWVTWKAYCERFLAVSSRLLVLTLPGWRDSTGVREEIQMAKDLGVPIVYWRYLEFCVDYEQGTLRFAETP